MVRRGANANPQAKPVSRWTTALTAVEPGHVHEPKVLEGVDARAVQSLGLMSEPFFLVSPHLLFIPEHIKKGGGIIYRGGGTTHKWGGESKCF